MYNGTVLEERKHQRKTTKKLCSLRTTHFFLYFFCHSLGCLYGYGFLDIRTHFLEFENSLKCLNGKM